MLTLEFNDHDSCIINTYSQVGGDTLKKYLFALAIISILVVNSNGAMAQNYWGDGSDDFLDDDSSRTVKEAPLEEDKPEPPKKILELPDVPDSPEVEKPVSPKYESKSSNSSPVLELGASTEKIPLGKKLKIVMNTNINAKKNKEGDPFSASVKEDILVDNKLVIPAGTLIRGRVGKVKKPGVFSKSGSIILSFDHIVTPLGKEITLDLDLSNANKINKKGALVAGDGFGGAIKDSAASGYNTAKTITKAGYDLGMAAGKVPVVATAPVGLALGTVAGTTVFATKSTIAIFKKGGNPVLNSGEDLEIMFADDLDIPVN